MMFDKFIGDWQRKSIRIPRKPGFPSEIHQDSKKTRDFESPLVNFKGNPSEIYVIWNPERSLVVYKGNLSDSGNQDFAKNQLVT